MLRFSVLLPACVGALAASFIGDTECDYRPLACGPSAAGGISAASAAGCLNEGLHGPGITQAQRLADSVGARFNASAGDVVGQAAALLGAAWDRQRGIFLSFTLAAEAYDAQYGIMNCSDAAKASDRPFCQRCLPDGCVLVLYAMDASVHGDHEYYSYRIGADGSVHPPTPFWRSVNNTFVPQQSDAYVAVAASKASAWVPYWMPAEGLVTAAAPVFSRS